MLSVHREDAAPWLPEQREADMRRRKEIDLCVPGPVGPEAVQHRVRGRPCPVDVDGGHADRLTQGQPDARASGLRDVEEEDGLRRTELRPRHDEAGQDLAAELVAVDHVAKECLPTTPENGPQSARDELAPLRFSSEDGDVGGAHAPEQHRADVLAG